ncbi:MAG TPA: hypothetical protein VGV59_14125 [Pyrinomonadaceae bacterium]|nr:hypothetical protein [Pyrinomonadaceae bacterium]
MKIRLLSPVLACIMCAALIFIQTGCGPSRDRLAKVAGYGQQLSALLEANHTLPASLLHEGVIDQATHNRLVSGFERSRVLIDRFNVGLRDVLAQERPNPASLVPLVAEMIEQTRALNLLPHNKTYQRALAGIEVSLRAIANYFALQRADARRAGYTDEQIAAAVGCERRVLALIVAYAYQPNTVPDRYGRDRS